MNPKARKLVRKLGDAELAEALALAGLDTPNKIKAVEDGDIEDAVGKDGLARVRAAFPKA